MRKFIGKMGGGLLPSRLREVLPETQAALQRAEARGQACENWKEAEQELKKSLQKFSCCRNSADKAAASHDTILQGVVAVADDDCSGSGEVQPAGEQVTQVDSDVDAADPAFSVASDQHLQLVSKMNEWGFLSDAQRLARLQQAEEAARCPLRRLSQAQLAEVVNTAAAALAAPRRQAWVASGTLYPSFWVQGVLVQ